MDRGPCSNRVSNRLASSTGQVSLAKASHARHQEVDQDLWDQDLLLVALVVDRWVLAWAQVVPEWARNVFPDPAVQEGRPVDRAEMAHEDRQVPDPILV